MLDSKTCGRNSFEKSSGGDEENEDAAEETGGAAEETSSSAEARCAGEAEGSPCLNRGRYGVIHGVSLSPS